MTGDEAFWAKVDQSGDCWLWLGTKNHKGYGQAFYNGQRTGSHRVAWMRSGLTIPTGMQLDHLCRNRACVNPAHLEVVDNRTNVLRGDTLPAANLAKEHCPKGHDYAPRKGGRYCPTCNRARLNEDPAHRRARQRAAYWADPEHYRAKKRLAAMRETGR